MKFLIIFVIVSQALQLQMATASLKCYNGTRNEVLDSDLTSSTCENTGDACYVVKMTQSVSNITSDTIVSMCLNKEACKMVTCSKLINAMPAYQESVTNCKVICCTSDLCLDDDSVSVSSSIAPSSTTTTKPMMATASLKCYNGTRNEVLGSDLTSSTCENTGDACYVVKMTQSVWNITTDTIVSMCLNKEACKMVTCPSIINAMPANKESVTNCKVICCTSDHCLDDDSVSVSSSIAPSSTTTTKPMVYTTSGNTVNMKGSVFVVSLFPVTVILISMATN